MYQIDNTSRKRNLPRREAVRVDHVVVLAQCDHKALHHWKGRFLARGYHVSETAHFFVCQSPFSPHVVLMHSFGQAELDADLICFIEAELTPFGIMASAREFGALLFAVLASPFPSPRNQQSIWRHFCMNTLTKLRDQMAHPVTTPPHVSYITPFAAIYRRVVELYAGQSLLDVGCSFGFLPVLMAEHVPDACIMACDNNPDALRWSTDLATITGAHHVTFSLQDLLEPAILALGTFDTVTALHVLEHLSECDIPVALTHLLQMTSKRLIVAVPYEEQAQPLYSHHQVFTPEKLHTWGRWCVDTLAGACHYWCEEVMGGMLIVERSPRPEEK